MSNIIKKIKWVRRTYYACVDGFQWLKGWIAIGLMYLRRQNVLDRNSQYNICLTTYSKRLQSFHYVIESLLRQKTRFPYSITVYLSRVDLPEGKITSNLKKFEAMGVGFVIMEENVRSYKKLVYAYSDGEKNIIITADDDVIYPRYWLEKIILRHKQVPNCIVAYRGHMLKLDHEGHFLPYIEMMKAHVPGRFRTTENYNLMPTGISGVLYPPSSLDPIVNNADMFSRYAPSADDIWFKLASLRRGTKCVQVTGRNIHFPFVPGSQSDSLNAINVHKSENDIQLKASFDLFPDVYKLLVSEHSVSL